MITLTKLNKQQFILNADLIETIEESPDTTIRLTSGKMYIVLESVGEVVEKSMKYYRQIYSR
ncbi:MAG: flagellar FlbD family protein [Oscillospiraceae bacterium]